MLSCCMACFKVPADFFVYLTQSEVLAAEVHGLVNVEAVHFDAVALIKRVPDNGTLVFICE